MMQRHTRAADFFYQCFAARLKFIQVRWAKRLVGRPRKDQICRFEVAHRPIVRRGQGIDLLCDPQRGLACLVIWSNVAHDRGVNCVGKNDEGIISHLGIVLPARESARNYDVRIGRADQEAKFFECPDFGAQFRDGIAQLAFAVRRGCLERVLILRMFQFALHRGEIGIGR